MKYAMLEETERADHLHTGACLCGEVRFALREVPSAVMCHCSQCRKAQGAAFACNFPINIESFRLISGLGFLKDYRSSANKVRVFCRNCGSPLWSVREGSNDIRIRSGLLDNKLLVSPHAHIFAQDCPKWSPIKDSLPVYERFEPGRK